MREREPMTFWYKNHRGEVREYTVEVMWYWYGETSWYEGPRHFLRARDTVRGVVRDFDIGRIKNEID